MFVHYKNCILMVSSMILYDKKNELLLVTQLLAAIVNFDQNWDPLRFLSTGCFRIRRSGYALLKMVSDYFLLLAWYCSGKRLLYVLSGWLCCPLIVCRIFVLIRCHFIEINDMFNINIITWWRKEHRPILCWEWTFFCMSLEAKNVYV